MHRGVVTHLALNGSAAIHDFELAAYGGTSEDVAAGLTDGTFGMAEETGREMNTAIAAGATAGRGMGEALMEYLQRRGKLAAPEVSDRKSTRLNSSHGYISYAVFCLKKKKK